MGQTRQYKEKFLQADQDLQYYKQKADMLKMKMSEEEKAKKRGLAILEAVEAGERGKGLSDIKVPISEAFLLHEELEDYPPFTYTRNEEGRASTISLPVLLTLLANTLTGDLVTLDISKPEVPKLVWKSEVKNG